MLILQDTKHREEEKKNVQEGDTSLEMSKEEFVKSYNLRRKDDTPKLVRNMKLINQTENQDLMMKKEAQMENQKILFAQKKVQKIRNQKSTVGILRQKVIA